VKSSQAIKRTRPRPFIGAECRPPGWISRSPLLRRAYALAAEAHGDQRRATDTAPFMEHVTEVAELLEDAGHDDELIAAALLHDAVERGSLTEPRLRAEMDEEISELVLALTESAEIDSFSERKRALRRQVEAAGARAITIFAADKLSDIRALRRGINADRESLEARMGTTVEQMASHYRESVAMVEQNEPRSEFVAALRAELDVLAAASA
jgi:guanosine-3',5'-bis(diphosphate) 3'-pyrophosphohydrolase